MALICLYNAAAMAARQARTEALGMLETAIERGFAHPAILDDPNWSPLRGSSRLEQLMAEVRARLDRTEPTPVPPRSLVAQQRKLLHPVR